ncbi:dihydrofolate reductase [Gorillibacterium sp. sgz5001074]|uniref:dihydrofolate reductase n=1 Tax=Gorillibacterium sp. sgz5001074 TaxID=3446695 RepID=UPI003F662F71
MITFVVAMDRNRGIGLNNKLPWHLPADLKFFRQTTTGHPVLMGRKTYESIGKPLPNRTNVVLTRDPDYQPEGVLVLHSPEEAVGQFRDEELFVIGGAEIFRLLMPVADKLVVTHIDHTFEADTFFPGFREEEWRAVSRTPGVTDEKNPYAFEFVIYERVRA